MKEQDKTPEKQRYEVEISSLPEKEFSNDNEDDSGSQENNGENARNVCQTPRRTKSKQT